MHSVLISLYSCFIDDVKFFHFFFSQRINKVVIIIIIKKIDKPDWDYRFIINYHLTKFVVLGALLTKRAEDVAYHLTDML